MNEAMRQVSEQATNNAATAAIAATETVTMMRAARCPKWFRDYKKPPVGRKWQFLYAEIADSGCKDGVADVFAYSQKPLRL